MTQASLGASPPPSWAGVKVEGWSVPPRSPFLTLGDELGLEVWGGLEWLCVSTKGGWGAARGPGVGGRLVEPSGSLTLYGTRGVNARGHTISTLALEVSLLEMNPLIELFRTPCNQ